MRVYLEQALGTFVSVGSRWSSLEAVSVPGGVRGNMTFSDLPSPKIYRGKVYLIACTSHSITQNARNADATWACRSEPGHSSHPMGNSNSPSLPLLPKKLNGHVPHRVSNCVKESSPGFLQESAKGSSSPLPIPASLKRSKSWNYSFDCHPKNG